MIALTKITPGHIIPPSVSYRRFSPVWKERTMTHKTATTKLLLDVITSAEASGCSVKPLMDTCPRLTGTRSSSQWISSVEMVRSAPSHHKQGISPISLTKLAGVTPVAMTEKRFVEFEAGVSR